jgi:hypothetical protein
MATNYYELGASTGDTFLAKRRADIEARNNTAIAQRNEGLVSDEAYARDRGRAEDATFDAEMRAAIAQRNAGLVSDAAYPRAQGPTGDATFDAGMGAAGQPPQVPGGIPDPNAAPAAPGAGVPVGADAAVYRALANHAARTKDFADFSKATDADRTARGRAAYQGAVDAFMKDPKASMVAMNGTPGHPESGPGNPNIAMGYVNGSDGKPTGLQLITIEPNGVGQTSSPLSFSDAAHMAGLAALMPIDAEAALQGMSKVDEHVATLFATKLNQQLGVQKGNNEAYNYAGANDARGIRAEAALQRAQAAADHNDVMRQRIELAAERQNKSLKPEDVAALNEINQQILEETNPAKAWALQAAFGRRLATASSAVGMLVPPGWMGKAASAPTGPPPTALDQWVAGRTAGGGTARPAGVPPPASGPAAPPQPPQFRDADGGYVERVGPGGRPSRLSEQQTELYRRYERGEPLNPRERQELGI